MIILKISQGSVIQTFKDGKCVEQNFVCGDSVEYEDINRKNINYDTWRRAGLPLSTLGAMKNDLYFPFNMVQPNPE